MLDMQHLVLVPTDFVISYIRLNPLDALTKVAPTGIFLATIVYALTKKFEHSKERSLA
jgi:hypothetical protein